MFELSQGAHEDGSPGSVVRFHGDTVTLEVRHCDDYDAALEGEGELGRWVGDALAQALSKGSPTTVEVQIRPDYSGELFRGWLADLLTEKLPSSVRSLAWGVLDGFRHSPSSSLGFCFVELPDCSALFSKLDLETLRLQGEWHEENAELSTEGVRHLGLAALSVDALEALDELDLDGIAHLELWLYDHENEGADLLGIDDLDSLLARELPALRALTIHGCEFGPELIEALPEAGFFEHLESLSLLGATIEGSFLDESCAEALLSEAFAEVATIDVSGSFSTPGREPTPLLERLVEESGGRIRG